MTTSPPVTCRDCIHADWPRTPTGRIKRLLCGQCKKSGELLELFTHAAHPPCLSVYLPHSVAIWPEYDASGCPLREVAAKG